MLTSWLSRRSRRPSGPAPRRRARPLGLEPLEDRTVPTTTVYLDFGDLFPAAGLGMTVGFLDTTLRGPDFVDPVGNPGVTAAGALTFAPLAAAVAAVGGIDYDGNGAKNAADVVAIRADTVALVRRYFEPFDVDVVVAGAGNTLDIQDQLRTHRGVAADARQNHTYVLVGGVTAAPGVIDADVMGQQGGADRRAGRNNNDDTAVVLANHIFADGFGDARAATALALTIAHEVGHTLGLVHTANTAPATGDEIRLTRSDMLSEIWDVNGQEGRLGVFSRFPLPRPAPGVGTPNAHDLLAADPQVGVRGPAYVTGTGAHDRITIRPGVEADEVDVTVEAFRNANLTGPITVPGTAVTRHVYAIADARGGILVDAGDGNDEVVIESRIGARVTVRGMEGTDSLVVVGQGSDSGSYRPAGATAPIIGGGTALRGEVTAGKTTIAFDEFEPGSTLTVRNFTSFSLATPAGAARLTVDSPAAARNRGAGTVTVGGAAVPLVPLTFSDVTRFTVDTASNGVANPDAVTIAPAGLVANVLRDFTVLTGGGADVLTVRTNRYVMPRAGGVFAFDAGAGADRVEAVATGATGLTLGGTGLTSTAGGTVRLWGLAGETAWLTGGTGDNTLTIDGWVGVVAADGAQGTDRLVVTSGSVRTDRLWQIERVDVRGGKFDVVLPMSFDAFALGGGEVFGAADLTVTGGLAWSGGTMTGTPGSGRTLANGGVALSGAANKHLKGRALTAAGASTWAGTGKLLISDGGVWRNTGTFTTGDGIMDFVARPGRFVNAGVFRKAAGAGKLQLSVPFDNPGRFALAAGKAVLTAGGTATANATLRLPATFDLAAGTTLSIESNGGADAAYTFGPGAAVTGPGTFLVREKLTATGAVRLSNLTLRGGTLDGPGLVTVTGKLTWEVGTMRGKGKTRAEGGVDLTGPIDKVLENRFLENLKAATWAGAGGLVLKGKSGWNNLKGAVLDIKTEADITSPDKKVVARLTNLGTIRKSAAGETTVGIPVKGSGRLEVRAGALVLAGPSAHKGAVEVKAGARLVVVMKRSAVVATQLTGGGEVDIRAGARLDLRGRAEASIVNAGLVRAVSGTTITGAYRPTAAGSLHVSVSGGTPGLTLAGGGTFAGKLSVSSLPADPAVGSRFWVIAGAASGRFASVVVPPLTEGRRFDPVYDGGLTLVVVE